MTLMTEMAATATAFEDARYRETIDRLVDEIHITPTAFTFPAATIWLDTDFLLATAHFKTIAGRHFSVKKAIGEIVAAVAAVFERHGLAVNPDRRFVFLVHPKLAEATRPLGTMVGGSAVGRFQLPDGPGYGIIFDTVIAEAWDIGTIVHEFVHAMMRDTDAEPRLLTDRPRLELFTDCLAAEATHSMTWRDHFRGGDYIAIVKREDPAFDAGAFIESVLLNLGGKEEADASA